MILFMFVLLCGLGAIVGAIADGKGHGFVPWMLFGMLLFIIALPCALLLSPNQSELDRRAISRGKSKTCPYCAEVIRREANVCRYCGRDVVDAASPWPEMLQAARPRVEGPTPGPSTARTSIIRPTRRRRRLPADG